MTVSDAPAGADGLDDVDGFGVDVARSARGVLAAFNVAGVLTAADVHVARRLAVLAGERRPAVALAAALAVRAPRLGHVHVDLAAVRATAAVERSELAGGDLDDLPWPEPTAWREEVAASPLTAVERDGGLAPGEDGRPFRLAGSRFYLERLWADERATAAALAAMMDAPGGQGEIEARSRGDRPDAGPSLGEAAQSALRTLFDDTQQRRAAESALRRRFTVIAGGPGTGKTTTVARMLAVLFLDALARGERLPLVALAAPTGKAAARLTEAVHAEAATLPVAPAVREALLALEAVTLHRLLGRRHDSDSRFRHDRRHALPHDVVVVDETSMVALSLMARLLEAVRRAARLVLVGDPGQLASVEAGAVLGDIVAMPGGGSAPGSERRSSIVVLERVRRFGGAIAELADAVRQGDAEQTVAVLQRGGEGLVWLDGDPAADSARAGGALWASVTSGGASIVTAARAGRAEEALDALGRFRLLCAHRRGPYGVTGWTARALAWLAAELPDFDPEPRWYLGRPIIVTENDYELGLFNGDTGVCVARGDGGLAAAFARRGEIVLHSPTRLGAVDGVHAMTIHKSQGSQFATAAVVLPPPESRLLSRELLYTAITRAERRLIVAGTPESVRAAVARPVARASHLAGRLWESPAQRSS